MFQTPRIAPGHKELIFRRYAFPWWFFYPHPVGQAALSSLLNSEYWVDQNLPELLEWSYLEPLKLVMQQTFQL